MHWYSTVAVFVISIWINFHPAQGTLELLLSGYENIPTDNSALVDITDVGTHAEDRALICRHGITGIPPTNPIDHWTFVSVNGDESSVDSTGFIVTRSQSSGEVRLERPAGIYPLEGTYKCSVMGMTETVTVCLFWPLESLHMAIEVVSQMERVFQVSCVSFGGSVISGSMRDPLNQNLSQLMSVDNQQLLMRGADNYSATAMRTGGENGDLFSCSASTVGSSHTANISLSVAGPALDVAAIQVPSLSPTLNVSWSYPTEGATVTAYTLHYNSTSSVGTSDSVHIPVPSDHTSVLLSGLIADRRTYDLMVETHSVHLNGYSEGFQYTPCVVSGLSVASKTSKSLTLAWDRPHYYLSSLTGLVQYRRADAEDARWVYVVDSSGTTLPPLTDLEEFTVYSVQMAVFDESKTMCVFSQEVMVQTGLGAVNSLQVHLEEGSIGISWSPPHTPTSTPLNYTVAYYATSTSDSKRTTNTVIQSLYWRILAGNGDVFHVTVTPETDTAQGESVNITAGIDFQPFQVRIDGIGRCGDLIEDKIMDSSLNSTTAAFEQTLRDVCSCEPQIKKAEFYCQNDENDFVIFRGQLFSPTTTTSTDLLSLLENWVKMSSTVEISQKYRVNSDCAISVEFAQSSGCVRSTVTSDALMEDEPEEGISVALLVGVAVACVTIGVLIATIAVFICLTIKKRYTQKHNSVLQRRAHRTLSHPNLCEANPRYTSTGEVYLPPKMTQRDLPLIPLFRREENSRDETDVAFSNHQTVKQGACGANQEPEESRAYETLSRFITDNNGTVNSGVNVPPPTTASQSTYEALSQDAVNPLYGDMMQPLIKTRRSIPAPPAQYETVEDMKRQQRPPSDCDYVKMQPALSTSSCQENTD